MLALFEQLFIVFIFVLIGYTTSKLKIFDKQSKKTLNSLILNITMPCSIIISSQIKLDTSSKNNFIAMLIVSIAYFAFTILIASLYKTIFKPRDKALPVVFNLLIFSNSTFLGFPILETFLPGRGIFYGSICAVFFNAAFFTWGTTILGKTKKNPIRELLSNINIWASVLMMIMFYFQIKLPSVLHTAASGLAVMTAPLSLILIGSMLASVKIKDLFISSKLYIIAFLRLIIFPTAAFFLAKSFSLSVDISAAFIILSGLPSGTLTAITASKISSVENANFASKGVLLTTLLFFVTIFYLAFLCNYIGLDL